MYPKFPFPIVVNGFTHERNIKLQEERDQRWLEQTLTQSTKSLIQLARNIEWEHGYENQAYMLPAIKKELATRPHQLNKKERREFVPKQQKRTERKTRGAR
jgi:hypothetical protein